MKSAFAVAGRLIRMLGVLVVLVLIEAGLPLMLARFAGWPLPRRLLAWDGIEHMLVSPIPDDALLKILACPLWLLWGAFTASLLVEIIAAVRGVEIHVPMLGPMQTLAAGLIGSLAIAVLPMDGAAMHHSQAGPATAAVAAVTHELLPAAPVSEARRRTQAADPAPVHVVEPGDTLSKIAERKLGSPGMWGRIWRLNAHKVQTDGQVFTDPDRIVPGWRLHLPRNTAHSHKATKPERPEGDTSPSTVERRFPPPPAYPSPPVRPPVQESTPAPDASPSSAQTPDAVPQVVVTVELPSGGLVSLAFAAGISTAWAAARFHRRRRRIPPPLSSDIPADPETDPRPAPAVRALRRAHLRTYVERDQELPSDTALMRAAFSIDVPDKLVAGRREDQTSVEIQPSGLSLGLIGPGARDAARVIVLDLLRQADNFRCEVIIGAHDAQDLFGAPQTELQATADAIPGLTLVETAGTATDRFIQTHFTRSRMLVERGAEDIDTLRLADPGEVLPAVVLVASLTDDLFDRGIGAILMSADRSGMGALLIGDWPAGTTCEVDQNGTVTSAGGPNAAHFSGAQLFHLPLQDGTACLRQLAEAAEDVSDAAPIEDASPEPGSATWAGTALIRLSILGRPLIQAKGRPGTVALGGLQLQLLVFLALHPDGATRDEICVALWPDKAVDVGVHNPLRHLRDALRSASGYADKGRRDAPFVKAHGNAYRLDPSLVSVDLWDFDTAVSEARTANDHTARLIALTRAADLCRGPLAQGLTCEWIDEARTFQTRTQVDVLSQLASLQEEEKPEEALSILERILLLDPDPEDTWRRIIRLQIRLGRRSQARSTAALLQKYLQELGVQPTQETEKLLTEL
ncbi:BTAD domain-containing putative transcriptional regulator [Sphaerisporangium sp. B11E5]|uniref:BTAD domain-containing putative transcriptional regulator n=1 Tax=Sphaerisporangium sp. B11E5 TaxID=3153563 RepID=UPI00325CB8B3